MAEQKEQYVALRWDEPQLGLLSSAARGLHKALRTEMGARWNAGSGPDRVLVERAGGVLDKLEASLLQILRLQRYCDRLTAQAAALPAPYTAFGGGEACSDFESLLLHGRAALDRLTWLVSGELGQHCSSYSTLARMLAGFPNDPRAQRLLPILDTAKPYLDGLFAGIDSDASLRDIVGHRQALMEGMEACFGVYRLSTATILLTDCEVRFVEDGPTVAVLERAVASGQYLPFVLLGGVAAFLSAAGLPIDGCTSTWASPAVVLSRYLHREPDGTPLGPSTIRYARRMLPSGFPISTRNVRPEIWGLAIELPATKAG